MTDIHVSFMIAGVQKAGTSALHAYLQRHPDIGMERKKETHFFDTETINWNAPDYTGLHSCYEPGKRVYGEATPLTLYWKPAHARIRAYNPAMKFILLFRDPAERALSHWRMETSRGRENKSFSEAIRDDLSHLGARVRAKRAYVERGLYAAQLESFRAVFPAAPMLFLTSDQLMTSPDAALSRIGPFVGVDPGQFPVQQIRKHVQKGRTPMEEADREYLEHVFAEDLRRFIAMTGLDVSDWPTMARLKL